MAARRSTVRFAPRAVIEIAPLTLNSIAKPRSASGMVQFDPTTSLGWKVGRKTSAAAIYLYLRHFLDEMAEHFAATEIVSSGRCRGLVIDDETDQSISADAFDLARVLIESRRRIGRVRPTA